MRTATDWFDKYAESHQNKTNKAIHWICIPLILLVSVGLVQSIPHPFGGGAANPLNWASVTFGLCVVFFYARLSWTIGAGMAAVGAACVAINASIAGAGLPLVTICVSVFVGAWVFQFVGHKIEGKKPSFFEDLQFLLVGPAWLLQFVYRALGVPIETRRPATQG